MCKSDSFFPYLQSILDFNDFGNLFLEKVYLKNEQ